MTDFRIYDEAEDVALAVAEYLYQRIVDCVAARGICHVVLPGGTTPARCMELLADMSLPWDSVHWYPGDERCYPLDHEERNDVMIKRCLFPRPENVFGNFHPMPAELGAELAAERYLQFNDIGTIDIAVLGMGEDGHTASLFPGNPALSDSGKIVAVHDAPKPPSDRVSFGLQALREAEVSVLIATGAGKTDAINKLKNHEPIPVTMVKPDICFVDSAAMPDDG